MGCLFSIVEEQTPQKANINLGMEERIKTELENSKRAFSQEETRRNEGENEEVK